MLFFRQQWEKTMDNEDINEINDLLKKIKDYELKSYDLEKFIKFLESKIESVKRKARPGFKKITNDDVEWLRLYMHLLKKLEARDRGEPYHLDNHEWDKIGAEFEKLKATIDDFELYDIINKPQWSIGGGCWYRIIDKTRYQEYIYERVRKIIDKIDYKLPSEANIDNMNFSSDIYQDRFSPLPSEKMEKTLLFRTNLKRIETPLEETVKSLEGILTQEDIEKWVQQFEEDDEQRLCLKLLRNLRFYDNNNVRKLCGTCHNKLLMDLERDGIRKIIFVPAGEAGKSASHLIYLYKIENSLGDSQITSHDKLDQANDYDTIVFIDDLIGTGNQFLKFVEKIHLDDLKSKGKNIYYLALVGFEKGIKNIGMKTQIKVKVGQKLTEQDLPLSEKSNIFSLEEKIKAKDVLEKYGEILYKDNGLGYKNFGALIAFDHRAPNITFSVMWSNAKGWFPVLKRYSS